jgi:hypothetical protein
LRYYIEVILASYACRASASQSVESRDNSMISKNQPTIDLRYYIEVILASYACRASASQSVESRDNSMISKNQPGHLPTLIVMIAVPLLSTKLSNFIFEVLNQLGLAFLQV